MKSCASCGKETEEAVVRCPECGSDSFQIGTNMPSGVPTAEPGLSLQGILADPARLFRALVIVANSAYLLSLLVSEFELHFLSWDTVALLNRNGHGTLSTLPSGIYSLNVLIFLATAVGLYQFSASARAVFAIFKVGWWLFILLNGVSVTSPLVGFLATVVCMADGAILVLAYATPLKDRFR
ncbi:MAG: hypothetical protein ABMA26_20320 [Limisphaerales bacterium]